MLLKILKFCKLLILGDFNVPEFSLGISNQFTASLNNFLQFNILSQFNTIQNTRQRILDLVLSNLKCQVDSADFDLVDADDHHPSLSILTVLETPLREFPLNDMTNQFNFKKADFRLLYDLLGSTNWDFLEANIDVDKA